MLSEGFSEGHPTHLKIPPIAFYDTPGNNDNNRKKRSRMAKMKEELLKINPIHINKIRR